MTVIFEYCAASEQHVFSKGAVERILDRCIRIHTQDEHNSTELTAEHKQAILRDMDHLASLGLRTLALASRPVNSAEMTFTEDHRDVVESDLVFRGIVGIYDPP